MIIKKIFSINKIDQFFNIFLIKLNDEKFKHILIFKQTMLQTTRNFVIVIFNQNQQYTIFASAFASTSTLIFFTLIVIFFVNALNTNLNTNLISINNALTFLNNNYIISLNHDELIIDFIVQKIRLLIFLNFTFLNKQQRVFDRYTNFRFVKNFFVNLLTKLATIKIFFNCDFAIIKIALTLFVKNFSIDLHESKIYKKTIVNAYHKIN